MLLGGGLFAGLLAQFADQLQLGLEVDVVRQFQVRDEAGGLDLADNAVGVDPVQGVRDRGVGAVDGVVVEQPQFKVDTQRVELLPGATADTLEPVTLLLNPLTSTK